MKNMTYQSAREAIKMTTGIHMKCKHLCMTLCDVIAVNTWLMEDKKFHKVQSFDTLHNFIADPKQKYKNKVKRAINKLYAANLFAWS